MIPAVGRYQAHDYIISHETGLSRSFLPVAITLLATTLDVQGVVAIRTAPRRPIIPNVSINTSSMNTDMSVFPSHSPRADSDDDPSPLAEYLDEAERSFSSTLGSPLAMDFDATIRGPSRRQRGSAISSRWVAANGHMDRRFRVDDEPQAGPSRRRVPTPPLTPSSPSDSQFAEHFKYLVATSGLLERTQLASHSTPVSVFPASEDESSPARSTISEEEAQNDPPLRELLLRWDILLAIGALVVALVVALGVRVALIPCAAVVTGAVFYYYNQTRVSHTALPETEAEEVEEEASEAFPQPEPTGQDRVVQELEELLSESKRLDQSITASLKILASRPDDPEHAHELRIALHRLFDDMTDSVAGATSLLTPMTDRQKLAVLSEMYNVHVPGGQQLRRASSSDEEEVVARRPRAASSSSPSVTPEVLRTALLSPRERAMARTPVRGMASVTASPFDPNDKFTKLPDRFTRHKRASWSTDWNSRSPLFRSGHEPRLDDEAGTDLSMSSNESSAFPPSLPDEKMPSIPGGKVATFSETSPPSSKSPSPYTPKKASPLAQALAHLEAPDRRPPNPFISLHKPPASQSPFRRSLQDIPYLPSTPISSQEKAANMAIARASASMTTDKRRSLQIPAKGAPPVLDFTREVATLTGGVNLSRTRSLEYSHDARPHFHRPLTPAGPSVRTSPGSTEGESGLKRLSLLSDRGHASSTPRRMSLLGAERPSELGLGASPLRPRVPARVPSVSPLTLGGLKAACLGVHLKRRRMACCLLGLHFNEGANSDYWEAVRQILSDLKHAMSTGQGKIDALRADAEREATAASAMASMYKPPITPPPTGPPTLSRGTDFAPRDSPEQAALASVDEVQRTLAQVWARCEDIRTGVARGNDVASAWADVRVDIGGMLRHVDRGRAATDAESSSADEEPAPASVPDFVRAWSEPEQGPGPEEIERLVDEQEVLDDEELPPPGQDQVFEGIAAAGAPRARSGMSRDERIALTREARARGLTFAQLTAKADPERAAEAEREIQAQAMRAANGQMVAELEGVFGAVRRRKGML